MILKMKCIKISKDKWKKQKLYEFKKISTHIITYNHKIVPLVCTRWPTVLCPKRTIDNCSLQNQRLYKCNIIEDVLEVLNMSAQLKISNI